MGSFNNPLIVLLSGPIGSGKSELARLLAERYAAQIVKSRDLIKVMLPSVPDDRSALQRAGDRLDRADGGQWVGTALARLVEANHQADRRNLFVVDAVRIAPQISAIRSAYRTGVHHVHLTAGEAALRARYEARASLSDQGKPFETVRRQKTERAVAQLAHLADVVVETDRCTEEAVLTRAIARLGLYTRATVRSVDVLVGGQYGSEGKGNIVGHIAPEYNLLVRVGGPNAGHKVFGDPVQVYYHLPSGSQRAPHAMLLLGAGSVIRVPKLLQEIQTHGIDVERLRIDAQAMIVEDCHIEQEGDLAQKISSTRQGVGAASAAKIMGRATGVKLARDVSELRPYICDAQELLDAAYCRGDRILLEGTQGTSLSMHHGAYPHVTSRDTTVSGCLADAGIAPSRVRRIVMVCRTFPIRVGGPSGPMNLEIDYSELAARSGIPESDLLGAEKTTTTNKQRRLAEFDWVQLRRSALLNGPTDIALTFVDYLGFDNRDAFRFEQLNERTLRFIEEVELVSGVPVSLISTNFQWRNVIDRRAW